MAHKHRTIKKHARGFPANIAVIEAPNLEDALPRIEDSLRKKPVNYVNFRDTSFEPSPELEKLLVMLRKKRAFRIRGDIFTSAEQVRPSLEKSFNDTVQYAKLDEKQAAEFKTFIDHLQTIIEPLTRVWGQKTKLHFEFRSNETTKENPHPHLDGCTVVKKDWKASPFNNCSFRVVASFNTASTVIFDANDVELSKQPYTNDGLFTFEETRLANKNPVLWRPAPWTLSILTSKIWTHDPAAHDWPVSKTPNKTEKRFAAVITVTRK